MWRSIKPRKGAGAPRHHPDVSFRGAKRRGALSAKREEVPLGCNLAVPSRITGYSRRIRQPYATGCRGRRPLQGACGRRESPEICNCRRRSLSAATDAIGWYVFIGTLYELEVPSRDCHVASLLAMTRQGSAAMGTVRRIESAVLLPLRGRAWLSPPLQGQYGLNGGWYKSVSAFPRLPRPLWGLAMTRQGSAAVHQCPPAVECSPSGRSLPVKGTPHP